MSHRRTLRPLGSFERAQVFTGERFPYNLVVVVRFEGPLSEGRLRRALDEIQRRTPLLRARVEGKGRRAMFRLAETGALPLRCEDATPDCWQRWVESELAGRFDRRGPLARCLCLRLPAVEGVERGDLVLTFHHAIADGVCVARLLRDLLALCAGEPAATSSLGEGLPASADEGFPASCRAPGGGPAGWLYLWRQAVDELSFRWRRRRRRATPPSASRCRVLTTELSEPETAALVAASRERRVSLTGALQAAMLLAVSRRRYRGERLPLRYFFFPVLRPYLRPPVEPGAFASYTVAMRFTLVLAGGDDLWSVAAAIGNQIDAATSGNDKFFATIWSPLSMRMVLGQKKQRMGTTALSYVGPMTLDSVGSGANRLLVRKVHTFVSNLALGPEYTAQARIHHRRLVWDVVYLDGDMTRDEASSLADEMKAHLVAAAPAAG